ncbi:MAG: glycoside hydrolase family 3 N-terminal domain-containing protein [Micrococcaceae bacterium]
MRKSTKIITVAVSLMALTACGGAPGWTRDNPTANPSASPSQPAKLPWGPSVKNQEQAKALVAKMSLQHKAGQVIVGQYSGQDPTQVTQQIKSIHMGGAIMMGDNIVTDANGNMDPAGTAAVVKGFNDAAKADGRSYGAMVGTDQEGGAVARLTQPATLWPNAMAYGASASPAVTKEANRGIATEVADLGFNIDYAPDTDLTVGADDPAINVRSMTSSPTLSTKLVPAAIQGMIEGGVIPSAKHFPGHGSVASDSHLGLPLQNASVADLQKRDWVPFKAAIDAGTPMIMMGHINVPALQPGVPSSLSKPAYDALRKLGFKGVITTDSLSMEGVTDQADSAASAVKALNAGADILLMPPDANQAYQAIVSGVQNGQIPAARLNDAVTKVVTMMLWQKERQKAPNPAAVGSQAAVADKVSAAGLTVVSGKCQVNLLNGQVQIVGGSEDDNAAAVAAAQAAGVTVGSGGPVLAIDSGSGGVSGDIVVATDTPWSLGTTDAADTKVLIYGHNPGAFKALFSYLTGKQKATGVLPVPIQGIDSKARCTP